MRGVHVDAVGRGDHEFVVVNPPKPNAKGLCPEDFSQWPEDSIIIDPWMGIVCPARSYPEALRGEGPGVGESEQDHRHHRGGCPRGR